MRPSEPSGVKGDTIAGVGLLRLSTSAAAKQRRLESLLTGRNEKDPALVAAVLDAQLLGSLELSGVSVSWDEATSARRGQMGPVSVDALRRAQHAVDPAAPLSVEALLAWHAAAIGPGGLRLRDRRREGLDTCPHALIAGRLEILTEWLNVPSGRELQAAQQGALVLARIVEILPFEDGNGRVSRLAASHMMVRQGSLPPILVGADRARLKQGLEEAFRFETGSLSLLLEEASERSLDVMIQTLTQGFV